VTIVSLKSLHHFQVVALIKLRRQTDRRNVGRTTCRAFQLTASLRSDFVPHNIDYLSQIDPCTGTVLPSDRVIYRKTLKRLFLRKQWVNHKQVNNQINYIITNIVHFKRTESHNMAWLCLVLLWLLLLKFVKEWTVNASVAGSWNETIIQISCANDTGCCWIYNNSCAVMCVNISECCHNLHSSVSVLFCFINATVCQRSH